MDVKDIKNVLMGKIEGIKHKLGGKKEQQVSANSPDTEASTASEQHSLSSSAATAGGGHKKLKGVVFAAMVVVFFVIGSVLAYNFYFFYEKDASPQFQLSKPLQPVPVQPIDIVPASAGNDADKKDGQAQGTEPGKPQGDSNAVSQTSSSASQDANKVNPAKKAAVARVSEHDPFKSEFEKKYQAAIKKEKGGSLSELEGSIKEAKLALPPAPLPPPPPAPKQLKLVVSGTVVSSKDTYAITDMGVIRVGNVVESFVVEDIKFDMVTLRQIDNKDELRNVFVKQDRSRQPGTGGGVPYQAGGQQPWPSNQ